MTARPGVDLFARFAQLLLPPRQLLATGSLRSRPRVDMDYRIAGRGLEVEDTRRPFDG